MTLKGTTTVTTTIPACLAKKDKPLYIQFCSTAITTTLYGYRSHHHYHHCIYTWVYYHHYLYKKKKLCFTIIMSPHNHYCSTVLYLQFFPTITTLVLIPASYHCHCPHRQYFCPIIIKPSLSAYASTLSLQCTTVPYPSVFAIICITVIFTIWLLYYIISSLSLILISRDNIVFTWMNRRWTDCWTVFNYVGLYLDEKVKFFYIISSEMFAYGTTFFFFTA